MESFAPRRRACASALATALFAVAPAAPAQVWEVGNHAFYSLETEATGTEFGHALTTGFFDSPGGDWFVVGAPGLDDFDPDGGYVEVRRCTTPLQCTQQGYSFFYDQDSSFVRMGEAIAAGDFDGDGLDNLAYGAPGRTDGFALSGNVLITNFTPIFLGAQHLWIHQRNIAFPEDFDAEAGDDFGAALAVGNFNGDAYEDLAIGAPGHDSGGTVDAGQVFVLYGSASGLLFDGSADAYFAAIPQTGGEYGRALAAGDFNGDGFDDLAIGEPGRTISGQSRAGSLEVLRGSAGGVVLTGSQILTNGSFGIAHEADDEFGSVLAAGDFDRRIVGSCLIDPCTDDLAIGTPDEDVGSDVDAGNVIVTYGVAGGGLSTTFFQLFEQDDVGGAIEPGDRFGAALAAGQIDAAGIGDVVRLGDDLAIGSPGEVTVAGVAGQGVVHLLRAYASEGLDLGSSQHLELRPGLAAHPATTNDRFGAALTIGDFDDDGTGDLAIGMPGRESEAGHVQILFGALFADGFERASTHGWSAIAPEVFAPR